MDDRERYQRGLSKRRETLGSVYVDRSIAARTALTREFQEMITRNAWGEIWTRPHFDDRTRRILVLGTLMALDKWDEFQLHLRAALTEGGFSTDDVKEILLQQSVYCGVPAANHAFKLAGNLIKELEQATPAKPG
jgi:4-carboxymuconolactone decarboxylase